jgi:hypothetical protein
MSGESKHDPLDADDDVYSALALSPDGWVLRDSQTGEEYPVSREELARLLADRRRMLAGYDPE